MHVALSVLSNPNAPDVVVFGADGRPSSEILEKALGNYGFSRDGRGELRAPTGSVREALRGQDFPDGFSGRERGAFAAGGFEASAIAPADVVATATALGLWPTDQTPR